LQQVALPAWLERGQIAARHESDLVHISMD